MKVNLKKVAGVTVVVLYLIYLLGGCSSGETGKTQSGFTFSNFAYRLLRTSSTRVFDEYSYKVDITNQESTPTTFSVVVTFYDNQGFAVDKAIDFQEIPGNTTQTVTHQTLVDYPQAPQVSRADVEVKVYRK